MRIFRGLTVTAAAALIAGVAFADTPPKAPDQPNGNADAKVGIGVICDTSEQAEQYVTLRQQGQDISPAVATVNQTAQQPRACGVAAIAFVPDKTMDTKSVGGKLMTIERINVVAGYDGSGWHKVDGALQYAIIESEGLAI